MDPMILKNIIGPVNPMGEKERTTLIPIPQSDGNPGQKDLVG